MFEIFPASPGGNTVINFSGQSYYTVIQNRSSNTIPVYLGDCQTAYTLAASQTLTLPDTHVSKLTFGDLADTPYSGNKATTEEFSGGLVAGGRVGNGLATSGASAVVSVSVIAAVRD